MDCCGSITLQLMKVTHLNMVVFVIVRLIVLNTTTLICLITKGSICDSHDC